MNILNKRKTFLKTIVEEEPACSSSDQLVSENGECGVSGEKAVVEIELGKQVVAEVLKDGTKTLDDDLSSVERCQSCEVYLGEEPEQSGQEEERSTQEETESGSWRSLWQDFAYNLLLSFLPTAWDVISDLRTAEQLKDDEETVGFAGLSFLFNCFPGLYLILDLVTQKLSKSYTGSKVTTFNIICGVSFSFAMIILFYINVLLFKYPAFVIGLGMVGVKGVALFHRTPLTKELSAKVTKYEVATESPLQLLLLLHIWMSGGPLFLGPIASSLLAIGKVNAELYLSSKPENLLDGADFADKLLLIIKLLPLFISTTFFRLGSGMIKHSGPFSRIAEPYSTLFFFVTVWLGTIVYTVLYLIIFFGGQDYLSQAVGGGLLVRRGQGDLGRVLLNLSLGKSWQDPEQVHNRPDFQNLTISFCRWLQLGMATAQLATNFGIIGYMTILESSSSLGAWSAVGLSEVFVKFSAIVVGFGLLSYILLLYHVFFAPV